MTDSSGLIVGVVLLLLLMALAIKGWVTSRQLQEPIPSNDEEEGASVCPQTFVSRVFSREDWEFVRKIDASDIERLFRRERKKVALVWVRQTSVIIRKLMREHARAARQSKDLEFSTELSILSQFLFLMFVCGTLSLAIQVAGPPALANLAYFAQGLLQRLANVHETFQAGALAKTASGAA
jgi:hypothetical protein